MCRQIVLCSWCRYREWAVTSPSSWRPPLCVERSSSRVSRSSSGDDVPSYSRGLLIDMPESRLALAADSWRPWVGLPAACAGLAVSCSLSHDSRSKPSQSTRQRDRVIYAFIIIKHHFDTGSGNGQVCTNNNNNNFLTAFLTRHRSVVSRTGRTEYQLLLMKASDWGRNVNFR